jgi:hypothetical protein
MPSNKAVKAAIRFIEHAYPDAIGAIPLIADPEVKAFLRIDIPFVNPVVIGYRGSCHRWFVRTYRLPRTGLGTLSTNLAHLSNADFNRLVRYQR